LTSEAAGIPDDLNPPALPNHNLYNLIWITARDDKTNS
jgi:hypothetical protein